MLLNIPFQDINNIPVIKQYNMRTKRSARDDGRIPYTKVRGQVLPRAGTSADSEDASVQSDKPQVTVMV